MEVNVPEPAICEIQSSQPRLREQMVEISKYGSRRSRTRASADRVRFLMSDLAMNTDTIPWQRAVDPPNPQIPPLSPTSLSLCPFAQSTLQITRRSALSSAGAYVAVSYCWNRNIQWSCQCSNAPLEILCEDSTRRHCATPFDVIHRSIAFAVAHGVNGIWIDQECIDQTDPVDKEKSIQEMDMIYQEADHAIAVLEYAFQSQAELDAFVSVCDPDFFDFDPTQIEVLESVIYDLLQDKWFERAWTLQESVSAGVNMTLLLRCRGLQKPPHFGPTLEDFEISIWDFQNAMVNMRNYIEEGLAANVWSDPQVAIDASNSADCLWNSIPTILPDDTIARFFPDYTIEALGEGHSHRQVCNAAQAITYLDFRYNSVPSDRLAILANLCNYDYRVDTKVLGLPGSSFTICAHTLAILNGDMSLLAGYKDDHPALKYPANIWGPFRVGQDARSYDLVFVNDDNDDESTKYGFSWGPKPSASLKTISYLEEEGNLFRLQPAILSKYGLQVSGVLWDINCTILLPETQNAFASRWQEELRLQDGEKVSVGRDRQKALFQAFLWRLLREIISAGFTDLAKTFWNSFQPPGVDTKFNMESYRAPVPYTYEMISNIQGLDRSKEEEISNRIRGPKQLSYYPSDWEIDPPELERLLIEQVCSLGALRCAYPRPRSSQACSPSSPQPYAWFEACELNTKVFTPATTLGDKVARSVYRRQAMSWRVVETGQHVESGSDILHCLGRRRGIWRTDDIDHCNYILD